MAARLDTSLKSTSGLGGGGGGRGYTDMFYLAIPTSWTSPISSTPGTVNVGCATGGGGGGGGTYNGYQAPPTSGLSDGGSGGSSTQTSFSNFLSPVLSGGAKGFATQPGYPGAWYGGNGVGFYHPPLHLDPNYFILQSFLNSGGTAGVGGTSNPQLGASAGAPGGLGGPAYAWWGAVNIQTNTVYPISIGQAGAGGGGGAGGGVQGVFAGAAGGAGGGPNGGSGASWGPTAPGGNGGLIPFSFLTQTGNNGANGATAAFSPGGTGAGGGGGGGGTGVHSYMIFYYND